MTTGPLPAFAAYEQAVSWSDMGSLDIKTALNSQYASSGNLLDPAFKTSALDSALRDQGNKIQKEFRIPSGLRGAVEFWLRIYTEYTTQHVVIFDSQHPEAVYRVLDFRDLSRKTRSRGRFEAIRRMRINAAMASIRAAMSRLAANPHPAKPDATERAVLAAVKRLPHAHSYAELAKTVRAQAGQRDNIVKGLLGAEAFLPKMEEIFTQLGVPRELTRLSLVESSFNLSAISRAGASGIWQFMPGPGHEFLKIDETRGIDERLSPLKSTIAAGRLLKRNHRMLHDWALAVIAYNHGLRGLIGAARGGRRARLVSFVGGCSKVPSPLGWASRSYYAEFLAVLYAEAYRDAFYGEPPSQKLRPVAFQRVLKPETAVSIAMSSGISLQEFHLLNPDVRRLRERLPRGFWVALPASEDDWSMLARVSKGRSSSQRLAKTRKARTRPAAG